MKIGLVIVHYNDVDNTLKLVNHVSKFKCLNSIVVVDNASTVDISALENIKFSNYKLIKNTKNFGYAYGMNIGAKYLNDLYDDIYICFSNTDIYIKDESVLKSLAECIDDDVRCVMPKVKENGKFKYGWKLTSALMDIVANIPYFNRNYRDKHYYYKEDYFKGPIAYVDVIYGCFFMISGETLENINYFDDKTFLYYEEYILARKLMNFSYKSVVNTKVFVEHKHNATIGTNVTRMNKYKIYKHSQLYYEKHYNNANFIYMIIFYILYLVNLIPYIIKSLKKNT